MAKKTNVATPKAEVSDGGAQLFLFKVSLMSRPRARIAAGRVASSHHLLSFIRNKQSKFKAHLVGNRYTQTKACREIRMLVFLSAPGGRRPRVMAARAGERSVRRECDGSSDRPLKPVHSFVFACAFRSGETLQ
jgi:hypothetical protein